MNCTHCNKIALKDEMWIKPSQPLTSNDITVVVDLVHMLEDVHERFCSKDCMQKYIEENNIKVDFKTLTIDVIKGI